MLLLRPGSYLELRLQCESCRCTRANVHHHKYPRMAAEALLQEWPHDLAGIVRQQLCLHSMDAGRVLQRLDDMPKQSLLDPAPGRPAPSIAPKQAADHALSVLGSHTREAHH